MVKVAVLGYGTVGSGVVEVLRENKEPVAVKAGEEICVAHVLDLREFPGDPVMDVLTHDYQDILNDPETSIVVETMGGIHPAYEFTKSALMAGKSVCTSNKALVAEHGTELMQTAAAHGVQYLFEASCGGGIPIIRAMNSSLRADVIDEISGILNGTTNYILTKMARDGSGFAEALKEAQAHGYAEADPTADVEGYDAQRKIAILSSVAYGSFIDYREVYCEGITKITAEDIKYALAMGAAIKLLAVSRRTADGVSARVCPVMIPAEHPLYSVNGVFNAVFIHGNMLGDAMFYGSGAGKLPTASAVCGDVIDIAMHPHEMIQKPWKEEKLALADMQTVEDRYFVRVAGKMPERLAAVREAFGEVETVTVPGLPDEFAFVTAPITGAAYEKAAAAAGGVLSRIRAAF